MQKEDNSNNQERNKKPPRDYLLTSDQADIIRERILSNIEVENILNIIDPKLKKLYECRASIEDEEYNKKRADIPYLRLFKICHKRMNNEEKMLLAFFAPKNFDQDLPDLLSYIELIKTKIEIVNKSNRDYILGHSEEILNYVIKQATEHYLASKLKVYITEEEEDTYVGKELTEEETRTQMEEVLNHPLFMTEIPDKIENNPHLEALQAIKYDNDAEEIGKAGIAQSKDKFHSYKEKKQFKLLKESMYEVCNAIDHCVEDDTVDKETKRKLFVQRSDINIHIKNWTYAIEDLEKALHYSNDNIVDYTQTVDNIVFCYINIKAYNKAEEFLSKLLSKVPSNLYNDYKSYYESKIRGLSILKEELQRQMEQQEIFKQMESTERQAIFEELSLRGMKLMPQYHKIPANCEAIIYKDEDSSFHFPILIIYEEFNMTDYIQDCIEDLTMKELTEMLFKEKLPWDKENLYTKMSIRLFYEMNIKDYNQSTLTTSYYPLKDSDTLGSIICNRNLLMNGFPVISIVSTNSKFFDHFLKKKIVLKRKVKY